MLYKYSENCWLCSVWKCSLTNTENEHNGHPQRVIWSSQSKVSWVWRTHHGQSLLMSQGKFETVCVPSMRLFCTQDKVLVRYSHTLQREQYGPHHVITGPIWTGWARTGKLWLLLCSGRHNCYLVNYVLLEWWHHLNSGSPGQGWDNPGSMPSLCFSCPQLEWSLCWVRLQKDEKLCALPGSHHLEPPTAKFICLQNDTDDDLGQLPYFFRPLSSAITLLHNLHDLFGGGKGPHFMKANI